MSISVVTTPSKLTVLLIVIVLSAIRFYYIKQAPAPLTNVITWDAFGYYLYLPGQFIYKDLKQMNWVEEINKDYKASQTLYQLSKKLPNGNRAIKYFMGISILNFPFFIIAHSTASHLGYEQDGFSPPYQLAICVSALFYAFIGFWVLRKVLLKYFSESSTIITLLLCTLGTNYAQYVSVDSGMSHGFIFTLYAILLYATIRWHEKPNYFDSMIIGAAIGLGVLCRPTEIVMIFIPLLYALHKKDSTSEKWIKVRANSNHLLAAGISSFTIIFFQLFYWKRVTGNWLYDVGSKWSFLSPNWQVLFGWEKGWFIYTPVAVLMVAGIFMLKKNPFYKSVLIYFLLNLWIVTAWFDWRYGASYSARALVQSYAVMALPLAALIQLSLTKTKRYLAIPFFAFLICLNLFQIWQYNKTILHYNDMNRQYYQAIFLDNDPTPVEMSLLDTKEFIKNESEYSVLHGINIDSQFTINALTKSYTTVYESKLSSIPGGNTKQDQWLKIGCKVLSPWGAFETNLILTLNYNGYTKTTSCRMQNGLSENMKWNPVEFYFKLPTASESGVINVSVETKIQQNIFVKDVSIKLLE